MREILFRGKAKDEDWVEGHLICKYDADAGSYTTFEIIEHAEYSIALEYDTNFRHLHPILVKEETVGQFTGMTDKNGERIFEDDIVKDARNKVGYVAFLQQAAGWVIVWDGYDSRMGHRTRDCNYDSDASLEVIGNIHDNPELLKGGGR